MAVDANNTRIPDFETSHNDEGFLPCPFCRGESLIVVGNGSGEWITCNECGAEGPTGGEGDAWDLWNARVIAAPLQDEINDLRAALSAISVHLGSAETHDPVIDDITRTALEKDWSRAKVAS